MQEWLNGQLDFFQMWLKLFGTNNRLFLAALVSYKWFVSINFMFSLKIEKESLLKHENQLSLFILSLNFKIWQILNKCSVKIKKCKIHNS